MHSNWTGIRVWRTIDSSQCVVWHIARGYVLQLPQCGESHVRYQCFPEPFLMPVNPKVSWSACKDPQLTFEHPAGGGLFIKVRWDAQTLSLFPLLNTFSYRLWIMFSVSYSRRTRVIIILTTGTSGHRQQPTHQELLHLVSWVCPIFHSGYLQSLILNSKWEDRTSS